MYKALSLQITVFLCGASVMVLELTGSRILAPFLGNSIFIWTSLIGIVLAALSVGYVWGGKLADRNPSASLLARLILGAGVYVAFITPLNYPLLARLSQGELDLRLAAVIASTLLFAFPAVLLGTVSPFAIKLSLASLETSGSIAGRLIALSTIGSIVGTFAAGFFLLGAVGSVQTIGLVALVLCLCSVLIAPTDALIPKIALIGMLLIIQFSLGRFFDSLAQHGMLDLDTQYQRVLILDNKEQGTEREVRLMITDPLGTQSVMYIDSPNELASEYSKFYDLAFHYHPRIQNALLIGGGAYSYAKHFVQTSSEGVLHVVELDSAITELAREHFGLEDSPRIKIYHEDARTYLNRSKDKFDAIFMDAFGSAPSVPFQLTTSEALLRMKERLTPDGVIIMNVISGIDGENGEFLRSLLSTFRSHFPEIMLFATKLPDERLQPQNLIIVAHSSKSLPTDVAPQFKTFFDRQVPLPDFKDALVLVDNFAPVENQMLPVLRSLERKIVAQREG